MMRGFIHFNRHERLEPHTTAIIKAFLYVGLLF